MSSFAGGYEGVVQRIVGKRRAWRAEVLAVEM